MERWRKEIVLGLIGAMAVGMAVAGYRDNADACLFGFVAYLALA